MGAISGDMGGYVMLSGAAGEYWIKVRITEDDSEWFAPKPPGVTVTLDPGSFNDYDLYVYYGSCGGDLYSSANWEGAVEQLSISWDDEWFPVGYDDSEDIYVLVKFFEAAPFYDTSSEQVACYPWSLLIEGYNYQ